MRGPLFLLLLASITSPGSATRGWVSNAVSSSTSEGRTAALLGELLVGLFNRDPDTRRGTYARLAGGEGTTSPTLERPSGSDIRDELSQVAAQLLQQRRSLPPAAAPSQAHTSLGAITALLPPAPPQQLTPAPVPVAAHVVIESMMPSALDEAMSALTTTLYQEAYMARLITVQRKAKHGTAVYRPFSLVQAFLSADPYVRQLSLSAFILANATHNIRNRLAFSGRVTMSLLGAMPSPLPALRTPLAPDQPFPQPEPGTCPWPRYMCAIDKYRSYDGSCNNLESGMLGRAFTPLRRYLPAVYADGVSSIRESVRGGSLPSSRLVSMSIAEDRNIPNHVRTLMLMQWGQFIDHDLSHTAISKLSASPNGMGKTENIECGTDGCSTEHPDCLPIAVPPEDPSFTTKTCLEFVRSEDVPNTNCTMGAREQVNQITSYIDASMVYGSSQKAALSLRDLAHPERGRLNMTSHPTSSKHKPLLPPTHADKQCNRLGAEGGPACFRAGDGRVNEQAMLMVMHTVWVREHNRIEEQLHAINPHWSGEQLYQETRRIVSAMLQHITYAEFLPVVLGAQQMKQHGIELFKNGYYTGYRADVDASISNVFATAAFRFGHSMVQPSVRKVQKYDQRAGDKEVKLLREMFFRPESLYDTSRGGMDSWVRGSCLQHTQNMDRFVTKEVTVHLFADVHESPHAVGTDLISLNIQRGRDHGLPGYNAWRQWCGLRRARDFSDLVEITDRVVREKFRGLYKHVDDIDIFPGALAEAHLPGAMVGPTFACIIGRQFRDLRDGDRYWYENNGLLAFSQDQLRELRRVSLSRVLCENSDSIEEIQPYSLQMPFKDAYKTYEEGSRLSGLPEEWFSQLWTAEYNARVNCSCLPAMDLSKWKDNISTSPRR